MRSDVAHDSKGITQFTCHPHEPYLPLLGKAFTRWRHPKRGGSHL